MSGVDHSNQLISFFPMMRKSQKWWKKLGFFLFAYLSQHPDHHYHKWPLQKTWEKKYDPVTSCQRSDCDACQPRSRIWCTARCEFANCTAKGAAFHKASANYQHSESEAPTEAVQGLLREIQKKLVFLQQNAKPKAPWQPFGVQLATSDFVLIVSRCLPYWARFY